jgi:RNase H-fold protein (predicted Holliday junction resolvase)
VEVSIRFVDEYATSYEAEERLRAKGIASKEIRKKRLLDAAAAALILQSFLDSQNRSESR